jgi:hypothetical protein
MAERAQQSEGIPVHQNKCLIWSLNPLITHPRNLKQLPCYFPNPPFLCVILEPIAELPFVQEKLLLPPAT